MSLRSDGSAETISLKPRLRARGLVRVFLERLISCLDAGRIVVVMPSGERIDHRATKPGPEATLVLKKWRSLRRLLSGGDVGFAEAYFAGDWSSPDLTALIELASVNMGCLERAIGGALPFRFLNRLRHLLKANTKTGSRRNIAFHYDLGNDFYRLWLDRSMTYSSAIYAEPSQCLDEAQSVKLIMIQELLELRGDEDILEIGCGWGALAAQLATQCKHITGLTLSSEQFESAQALAAARGLGGKAEFRLQDYRDAEGRFDRIVSVEMLEAVGERYWPEYFASLRKLLNPGGQALLQAITIDEARFDNYRKNADFIQRYIFPGGMLPTKAIIADQAARAGLSLSSVQTFGASYALTLAEWRRRFLIAWPSIEKLGFTPSFRRLWEYYLSYSEAGFRTGVIDVGLYSLRG